MNMTATCEYCGSSEDLSFCARCGDYVCNDCWDKRRKHRDAEDVGGGIPHEKVSPRILQQLTQCMAEPLDDQEQTTMHLNDEDTTWFAFDRDDNGNPFLAEYQRYAALMMDCAQDPDRARHPALVSFIGQTGAGKSSLIKLLIDMNASKVPEGGPTITAPIIGRSASPVPTSADVHLYVDPATCASERPILYADCEGFDGGERDPVAAIVVDKVNPEKGRYRNPFERIARGTKRALKWADRSQPGNKERGKRGYAVAEMYPRIFYAFSDVVVFVLNQPKTLEVVVERLLKWAAANYTNTANLPSKPHAIIALNKSGNNTEKHLWDRIHATSHLLESASAQIEKNTTFRTYVDDWKRKGVDSIDNMKELLKRYYSTVHVIRLPELNRYNLLDDQRALLYQTIRTCCDKSLETKIERQMSLDADDLGLYLSLAFDHFSEDLDRPFDFIKASLKRHPPPETFKDSILSLANMLAKQQNGVPAKHPEVTVAGLFGSMEPFIASCLMLDAARKNRFGRPEKWFKAISRHQKTVNESNENPADEQSYMAMCDAALTDYFLDHAPCDSKIPYYAFGVAPKRYAKCNEKKRAHRGMHRGHVYHGGVLHEAECPGEFHSDFDVTKFAWAEAILTRLETLHENVSRGRSLKRTDYLPTHSQFLREFYGDLEARSEACQSNSVCLGCLSNPPEHQLICGHILCTQCAFDFGQKQDDRTLIIEACPLHTKDTPSEYSHDSLAEKNAPCARHQMVIRIEPPFAGLRVLTLDGGGVRGILEIGILRALEDEIGVQLQQFFDLVVGTSTGGILALAFGDQSWSLQNCDDMFCKLVVQAFSPRKGQKVPWISQVQSVLKSKYRTRPLEVALQEAFSANQNLFGRRTCESADAPRRLKVAVTSVSNGGDSAFVISNYNTRNESRGPSPKYRRYRPDLAEYEIKIWEAARATSAAPGFFRPFPKHRPSLLQKDRSQIFPQLVDGAVKHNNPIEIALEETARLSEAGGQSRIPDILLSIGSGREQPYERRDLEIKPSDAFSAVMGVSRLKTLFTMIRYQVKLNLDTDRRWTQVINTRPDLEDRLKRINPDLGGPPPALDDTDSVLDLRQLGLQLMQVRTQMNERNPGIIRNIRDIACRLVASSFYFERDGDPEYGQAGSMVLSGHIKCRLNPDKEDMRNLAKYLSRCRQGACFIISEKPRTKDDVHVQIPMEPFMREGLFDPIPVKVLIPVEETTTTIYLKMFGAEHSEQHYAISGFPRILLKEDFARR